MPNFRSAVALVLATALVACGGGDAPPPPNAGDTQPTTPLSENQKRWIGSWAGSISLTSQDSNTPLPPQSYSQQITVSFPPAESPLLTTGLGRGNMHITANPAFDGIGKDFNWPLTETTTIIEPYVITDSHGGGWFWTFTLTSPDLITVVLNYNSGGIGKPAVIQRWTGSLTRAKSG